MNKLVEHNLKYLIKTKYVQNNTNFESLASKIEILTFVVIGLFQGHQESISNISDLSKPVFKYAQNRPNDFQNRIVWKCFQHILQWFSFQGSETFNYGLEPQVAHIMSVVFLTITLHCIDRQTDYMNRLDHLLNLKLKIEQEEANKLQIINKNLLMNVLPKHVGMFLAIVSKISLSSDFV